MICTAPANPRQFSLAEIVLASTVTLVVVLEPCHSPVIVQGHWIQYLPQYGSKHTSITVASRSRSDDVETPTTQQQVVYRIKAMNAGKIPNDNLLMHQHWLLELYRNKKIYQWVCMYLYTYITTLHPVILWMNKLSSDNITAWTVVNQQ